MSRTASEKPFGQMLVRCVKGAEGSSVISVLGAGGQNQRMRGGEERRERVMRRALRTFGLYTEWKKMLFKALSKASPGLAQNHS